LSACADATQWQTFYKWDGSKRPCKEGEKRKKSFIFSFVFLKKCIKIALTKLDFIAVRDREQEGTFRKES
jgi:hypothetical protein